MSLLGVAKSGEQGVRKQEVQSIIIKSTIRKISNNRIESFHNHHHETHHDQLISSSSSSSSS
jgi:hypothetical protein